MKVICLTLLALVATCCAVNVEASDWGCEVALCLSNPQGPTAVAECVPPIKKLYRELAKGHAFPSCGGVSNKTTYHPASPDFCPQEYLRPVEPGSSQLSCAFNGALVIEKNGRPVSRIWTGNDISLTESLDGETITTDRRRSLISSQNVQEN